MLQKIEINGVHLTVDENLRKYINKKIGRLDKYVSSHNRESAHAQVHLKEAKADGKKQCTCEVILHLPHDNITARESTLNMYAAVDIVEAKLKQQIQKHKDLRTSGKSRRRLLARFRQHSM